MRSDADILADLDRLRDRRATITQEEYRLAWERLWEELRRHDRQVGQAKVEEERQAQEQALDKRAEKSGDKEKSLDIAPRFHRSVKRLCRSKRGEAVYGKGEQKEVLWLRRYRPGGLNIPTVW